MTSESLIGLVVLNYNNADETLRFLDTVRGMESIAVIQVVDNASTDNSLNRLMDYCTIYGQDKIKLCRADHNDGYAAGNNLGVRELLQHVPCSYVLIANPDTSFSESAVQCMRRYLIDHPDYAAATPLMTKPSGEVCQSAWKLPNKGDMVRNAIRLFVPILRDSCDYRFDYSLIENSVDVDVLPGALFMIRASSFELVEGFDEDTFLYGEENILFAKIKYAGLKCVLLTNCTYVHAHGTSINKEISSVKRRFQMLLDSNLVYCEKMLGASDSFRRAYKGLYGLGIHMFAFLVSVKSFFNKARINERGRR